MITLGLAHTVDIRLGGRAWVAGPYCNWGTQPTNENSFTPRNSESNSTCLRPLAAKGRPPAGPLAPSSAEKALLGHARRRFRTVRDAVVGRSEGPSALAGALQLPSLPSHRRAGEAGVATTTGAAPAQTQELGAVASGLRDASAVVSSDSRSWSAVESMQLLFSPLADDRPSAWRTRPASYRRRARHGGSNGAYAQVQGIANGQQHIAWTATAEHDLQRRCNWYFGSGCIVEDGIVPWWLLHGHARERITLGVR